MEEESEKFKKDEVFLNTKYRENVVSVQVSKPSQNLGYYSLKVSTGSLVNPPQVTGEDPGPQGLSISEGPRTMQRWICAETDNPQPELTWISKILGATLLKKLKEGADWVPLQKWGRGDLGSPFQKAREWTAYSAFHSTKCIKKDGNCGGARSYFSIA